MLNSSISVLLLTKNRDRLLAQCLAALSKQTVKIVDLIIIDNNSTDQTKKVLQYFSEKLPVKIYTTRLVGYPALYNYGFSKCNNDIVCVLNDDCVPKSNWYENCIKCIKSNNNIVYLGKVVSLPKMNIYAEIMSDHYQNWLADHTIKNDYVDVIDNKNVIIPKKIFNTLRGYNEKLTYGAEDIEFGTRLVKHGYLIKKAPLVIAFHKERDTFSEFIKQHIRIAKSEGFFDSRKIKNKRIGMVFRKKDFLNILSFFKREKKYITELNILNFIYTPLLYFILFTIRIVFYAKKN